MDFSACGTASVAGCGSGGPRRYRGSKAAVRSELGKNLGRKAMRAGIKSVAAVVLAASLTSPALAQETIKMGALATLEGAFAVLGEDSMRGVRMALAEFDHTAGGKKIELVTGRTEERR